MDGVTSQEAYDIIEPIATTTDYGLYAGLYTFRFNAEYQLMAERLRAEANRLEAAYSSEQPQATSETGSEAP